MPDGLRQLIEYRTVSSPSFTKIVGIVSIALKDMGLLVSGNSNLFGGSRIALCPRLSATSKCGWAVPFGRSHHRRSPEYVHPALPPNETRATRLRSSKATRRRRTAARTIDLRHCLQKQALACRGKRGCFLTDVCVARESSQFGTEG